MCFLILKKSKWSVSDFSFLDTSFLFSLLLLLNHVCGEHKVSLFLFLSTRHWQPQLGGIYRRLISTLYPNAYILGMWPYLGVSDAVKDFKMGAFVLSAWALSPRTGVFKRD